jgi:hypothetical protein
MIDRTATDPGGRAGARLFGFFKLIAIEWREIFQIIADKPPEFFE